MILILVRDNFFLCLLARAVYIYNSLFGVDFIVLGLRDDGNGIAYSYNFLGLSFLGVSLRLLDWLLLRSMIVLNIAHHCVGVNSDRLRYIMSLVDAY